MFLYSRAEPIFIKPTCADLPVTCSAPGLPSFVNGRVLLVRSPRRLQIFRARNKENGQDDIEGDDAHEQPFDHSALVASEAVQIRGMQRHKYLPAREIALFEQIKMERKLLCVSAFTQEYGIYRTFTSVNTGSGIDTLYGGLGADTFDLSVSPSGQTQVTADHIADFSDAQGDRVHVAPS